MKPGDNVIYLSRLGDDDGKGTIIKIFKHAIEIKWDDMEKPIRHEKMEIKLGHIRKAQQQDIPL